MPARPPALQTPYQPRSTAVMHAYRKLTLLQFGTITLYPAPNGGVVCLQAASSRSSSTSRSDSEYRRRRAALFTRNVLQDDDHAAEIEGAMGFEGHKAAL